MSAPILTGEGLTTRRIRVERGDIAWVRYVFEAHDGLASLHFGEDGTVTLVTPECLAAEVDAVIDDLDRELALSRLDG